MARRPKTPEQIRESHGRRHLRLEEAALIPACKRLCAEWHNRIGACLTLDGDRLRGLLRRLLYEQLSESDVLAAIEAYAHELATDPWRKANPQARMDFAAFLLSGRFEQYLERGLAAREKARRQTQYAAHDRDVASAKAQIMRLAGPRLNALVAEVVREVGLSTPIPLDDARVRARLLERLRAPAAPPADGTGRNLWSLFRQRPHEVQRQYELDALAELDRRPGGYLGVRSIASPAVREIIMRRLTQEVQHADAC